MKDRIKEVRKHFHETQDAFSEKLSLSKNFVWMIEKGEREPSDRTIKDICRIYSINEEWLRTGEGEMMRPLDRNEEIARITDQMLDEVEPSIRNSLHRIVADMTEEDLAILLKYARQLVADMDEKNLPQ